MAGFFVGGGKDITVGTRYNSLGLQSSQQGLPVPIIYGTVKISGNLIWYGDFTSHEHREETGGKGGGGPTMISYTYSCAVAWGIAEGVVDGFGTVWKTDGKTTLSNLNLSAIYGTGSQGAWSYLSTKHPDQALNYRYTAYLASSSFDLGQYNALPQLWFEVRGLLSDTGAIEGAADPADVVYDFLTNTRYGCRFPAACVDEESLRVAPDSFRNYCGVNGIAFSVAVNENKPAREYLSQWLEAANTAPIWSGDQLKFIPFGDKPMTGHGFSYTPDLTIRYVLTADDLIHEAGEEPVEITRADPHDCYNHIKLQVRDKDNEYNTALCEVKDQASIELIGLRTREQVAAEFLPTPTAGMMAAELIKNRGLHVRNRFRFRLSWEYALLEAMDLVALDVAELGLNLKPVRIMEINEDEDGLIEILAEEFLEGSQWSVQYPAQGGGGYVGNIQIDPGSVNPPVIFEPPSELIGLTNPEVWIVVNGDPDTWGGARVWMSIDGGEEYAAAGNVQTGALTGELTADLSTGGGTLSVDLSECGGALGSVTPAEAELGRTAMLVGDEVIAYTTATLTGPNRYSLTGLVRGMYGTALADHETGDRMACLGVSVFRYTIPNASYYGAEVYLKFTSYNLYGAAEQSLDAVSAYAYTITGAGVGGGGGEFIETLTTGINLYASPTYSSSTYASKGTTFLVGSRAIEILSVSVMTNTDNSAKYKCMLATVDVSETKSPITAILGVSDETALPSPSAGVKTFHFSTPVSVPSGVYLAVIIVRVDALSISVCEVSFPSAHDQGYLAGEDLVYRESVKFASNNPVIGSQTLSSYTSAVSMGIFYTAS